jgi:hypothetical protein
MKYTGKLYGNIGGKEYFPLVLTSEDVDKMQEALKSAWIAMDSIDDEKADEWQDEFQDLIFSNDKEADASR